MYAVEREDGMVGNGGTNTVAAFIGCQELDADDDI